MRLNWNKIVEERGKASVLQVLILVVSIFAFAFIVASAWEVKEVSAEGTNNKKCCLEMNNGAICQDIDANSCDEKCKGDCQPSSCDSISQCKIGCCFDEKEGLCINNAPKEECEKNGGRWDENPECSMQECGKACCILGSNAQFVTERRCEILSEFYGYKFDFQSAVSELECLIKATEQEEGACILSVSGTEEKTCKFGTKAECIKISGNVENFKKGMLCSNPNLNTGCEKQKSTGCVEGKDEVYWFDSCGNRENIYDSNKERSWNNGIILSKEKSCLATEKSGNANSVSCGNCNYKVGSMCGEVRVGKDKKPNYGDYICQDLSCKDDKGNKKLNGESWCEYESYIGDGKDVPGSRHIKKYCQDGKIVTEPCSDYRNGVCAEGEVEDESGNERNVAICRYNAWRSCLIQNNNLTLLEEKPEVCTDIDDCELKNINVDSYFKFNSCVPKYPPGFDIKSEDKWQNGINVCGLANQTCTVVYVKKGIPPKWVCEANCECESKVFTEQMHDFCTRLGDCGSYINILGEGTDEGYSVKNAPRLNESDIESLKIYAKPVEGQFVELGEYAEMFEELFLDTEFKPSGDGGIWDDLSKIIGIVAAIVVGLFLFGGPIGMLIAYFIVKFLLDAIFGWGDTKTVNVEFTCMPWQAPDGGDNCEKCHKELAENGVPCTKYRCQSLGKACEILNEGTGKELCVAKDTGDKSPPEIDPYKISEGYEFIDKKSSSVKIRQGGSDKDCVQEFQEIQFSLETDEPAQCKFSYNSTATYDEMLEFFDDNMFKTIHNRSIIFPSVDSLEYYELNNTHGYIDREGNLDVYVRCKDFNGNWDLQEYRMNFCVKRGPDLTAPYVTGANPPHESYLAEGTTEREIVFSINEPAGCKYSKNDVSFDTMENTMNCTVNLDDYGIYGSECYAKLSGLTENNVYYVRCKDQPWLPKDNESRNIMAQSYRYNIKVSKEKLEIASILPEGNIFGSQSPFTVELEVKTGGGAKGGEAVCYYSFSDYKDMIMFYETSSDEHKQIFNRLTRGDYTAYVKCVDEAGNVAKDKTEFTLDLDTDAPQIIRMYNDNGLKFITDEKAMCVYSTDSDVGCSYNFEGENITKVDSDYIKEHNMIWDPNDYYYIKCKDKYGNKHIDCIATIKPYDVRYYQE